jgi:hypothetical protein
VKKIVLTALVALIYSAAIAQSTQAAPTSTVGSECEKLKQEIDATNLLIFKLRSGMGYAPNAESKKRQKQELDAAVLKLQQIVKKCHDLNCKSCK